jgi:hypothetical protein
LSTAGLYYFHVHFKVNLFTAKKTDKLNNKKRFVGFHTATSFPLSKHTGGGDTAPAFSSQHIYLQFTWEVGLPPSPVEVSSHRHFYKLSCSWLLGVCHGSCLLRPACLFTVL